MRSGESDKMKKRIYFIRHGETDANLHEYVPGKDEPLNATGLEQARQLAQRVGHIEFEKLFVSDFLRAQQTADAIVAVKPIPVHVEPLFGEMLEPSSLFKTLDKEEAVQSHRKNRDANVENPQWRQEDGENHYDVFSRIEKAKILLEGDTADKIVVASHGFFTRLFTAAILSNSTGPTYEWFTIAKRLALDNTGVTLFVIDNGVWYLVMWNDHAHFAE